MLDQTKPIRQGEELNIDQLNSYLIHKTSLSPILEIQQFPGGYSNLTYSLTSADGQEYVLRRPPHGANIKSAHDMGREYKVLSLLKSTYPLVPTPIHFCEDIEIIGSPFYIMERLKGTILRTGNTPNMGILPSDLTNICEQAVDNLVNIHALDIQTANLLQLGKPEGYVQRQVDGWIKRYQAAETDKILAMDNTISWLQTNQPRPQSPAMLHNDYKLDNLIFSISDHPKSKIDLIGTLDWEMATVGDPLMDLGATLAYWVEAADGDNWKTVNCTWMAGMLTRKEVVERYQKKSGRDLSDILFYYVFGLFKNAVILQQIYARWKQGHTQDPRFGQLIFMVKMAMTKAEESIKSGQL
jgi:aminoglycoside phosphotransferase (APT) family kinase protein